MLIVKWVRSTPPLCTEESILNGQIRRTDLLSVTKKAMNCVVGLNPVFEAAIISGARKRLDRYERKGHRRELSSASPF